jgi:hypothetical protein
MKLEVSFWGTVVHWFSTRGQAFRLRDKRVFPANETDYSDVDVEIHPEFEKFTAR